MGIKKATDETGVIMKLLKFTIYQTPTGKHNKYNT